MLPTSYLYLSLQINNTTIKLMSVKLTKFQDQKTPLTIPKLVRSTLRFNNIWLLDALKNIVHWPI